MSRALASIDEDLFDPAAALFRSWTDALNEANVIGLGNVDPYAEPDAVARAQPGYLVDEATFDLPVELQLVDHGDGRIGLHASSPTQKTETTVLPVWHRMRLTLAVEEVPNGSNG